MAAYASYRYYRETFGGREIPEELFCRCARAASVQIDAFTFHRITDPDRVEGLADCTCEMAETVYRVKHMDGGRVIKSENTDGYSVTYLTEQKDGEDADVLLRGKLYAVCAAYLAHTGLMCRRVSC